MSREEHKPERLCGTSTHSLTPANYSKGISEALVPLCLAALRRYSSFRNSPQPFLNPHKLSAFRALAFVNVLYREVIQYKPWAEQFPRAVLKPAPVIWLCWSQVQRWCCHTPGNPANHEVWQSSHTRSVSKNMRGYYGYFLTLSEGLQAHRPGTVWNKESPVVSPWAPASKHLLTYKTLHSSQRDDTCEQSPPQWYLSGFPAGRKHVPSCAEWLMCSVLIFVSQVINLLRSRGSGVTIKQPLKVETARISAMANEW